MPYEASLQSRSAEFLRSPVAAVMSAMADREKLGVEQLADPATVCMLATCAISDLTPWAGDGSAAATLADALDVVGSHRVRNLVEEVLRDERNTWWSAPPHRANQLLMLGQEDHRVDPDNIPVPTGPISNWETYAQKPTRSLITTTELSVGPQEQIRSGGHATLARGRSDWNPVFPVEQYRCRVAATARVFEINSAADWRILVARYGDPATHHGSDANLLGSSGIDNGLAPTWSAVAQDYDGVHLSFAGLLTAVQAPVSGNPFGTTTLWAWEWECTHWIRSVFSSVEELPPMAEPPEPARHW